MYAPSGKWRKLARGEDGSVTLEASMVFPWVLIMTFLLILFSIVLTERVLIYYSASVTGERAAFAWSNSAKDVRTGAYPSGRYDGLYWRLNDDSLLAGLFGWATHQDGVQVSIEAGMGSGAGSSAEDKLHRAGATLPQETKGTMRYRNQIWTRLISIQAGGAQLPAALRRFRGGERLGGAGVSAVVVEPAELIRMFDVVRYFKAKMAEKGNGAAGYRAKAAAVLDRRR